MGCYNSKGKSIYEIVNANLNLKTCSIDDLEKIYGIGKKTSRCFIIHSMKAAQCAGLDTHILKYLKSIGHDVPSTTPSSKKEYRRLEKIFLDETKRENKSVAEFDLEIWNRYSKK